MPLIYLMVVLFAGLVLVTPLLTIFLLVRQARLRRELNELTVENEKRFTKLQRAVGELQSKLAAAPAAQQSVPAVPPAPVVEKPAVAEAHEPVVAPRTFPAVPIPPAPSVPPPKVPAPVPPSVEAQPPVKVPPVVPPWPVPHVEKKPEVPAAEQKPPSPAELSPIAAKTDAPSVSKAPASPAPPRVTPTPPAAIPSAVPVTPSLVQPKTSVPPLLSPLKTSTPQPTFGERKKSFVSFEETLGASWFAILGVIMTVIGLALLGKLALQHLGPGGKAFILYAISLGILAGGIVVEKRERYQSFGRVAIGGGWALLFFSTFGIHYVSAMRVLDSGVLDSALMLIVAIAMGAHTLRYKSQFVTGLAFLLGYATVALSQDTVYSLSAGVMLAIGLVVIVHKMGWYELEVFGILSSYLNHLYWLYGFLGIEGARGRAFPQYQASLGILFFYWLTFRVSYVAREIKSDFEEHVSTVSAILNTVLLLGVMKFQSVQPELAYIALLAIGALEFSFAQLPITRRRRRAFVLLSILGAALMLGSVPSHYSGNNVANLWLVGAEAFLAAGIIFKEVVFLRLGLFTGLLVGIDLIAFNLRPLVEVRGKSEELVLSSGVLFAACAVVFYLNDLYVASRWKESFSASLDRRLLTVHSYLGAFAAATAAWALFSYDWTAVAFAAIMLILAAANRRMESRHLQIQYALLGVLTLYRAFVFNLHLDSPDYLHVPSRAITLPILGAIFYATAWLTALNENQEQRVFRALFSFAGAGMFGFLIWTEAPAIWMGPLFLAAGIILALGARRWNLLHLSLQEHLFAAAAILRTLYYNCYVPGHYGPFSIRLVTVTLVAAGLYAISRRATNEDAPHGRIAAYLHTTAATFLLALLMWYETGPSSGWLAAFWAVFALVLAAIDRRFELDDLRWQAHALAAITLLRCLAVNLHTEALWHGLSIRLLTLSLVAVVFYALSLFIRMPSEWRERDFHHLYSWAASLLVSLLVWYELDPLGRAVGWAVFGLVLFEYGFQRKIVQFRYQAYVAFLAAFARIFFANLTAGEPRELFGPRMYTVLPLILIFFFVYAQLTGEEETAPSKMRFRSGPFLAYLGTATLMALFYFQFDAEWVVVSYAGIALGLYAAAWGLKRPVFLHQGILVTLATLARGTAHNLFGSSYFGEHTWSGRYFVVSMAIALLFATLFFAFRLRDEGKARPGFGSAGGRGIAGAIVAHPEQIQFFVPILLLTIMLALKTTAGLLTFSWGVEGALIVFFALAIRERSFLHAGFGLLLLCIGKVVALDMWRLDLPHKVIAFIGVGLAASAVSFLYIRFSANLRQQS